MAKQYVPLGPLMAGEGSRAFLGVEVVGDRPGAPAVLVFVPPEVANDGAQLESLRRETERATIFDHPNIIRVYGLTETPKGQARVVEYADGESVRRLLDAAGKLPLPIAARIAVDAATGVHYGHLAGNDDGTPLVHGDLRPETLLVSFKGSTKVTGYGALGVAPKERGGQRVKGRRHHCAPEQLVGGRDTVNVQTDVFLLGVLLHELLTGKIPFRDADDFDHALLATPIARIGDLAPAVMQVLDRATAKKAAQRYPSALAFREALEAVCRLAGPEEVAAELRRQFPPHHPAIAARKALLDRADAVVAELVASAAATPIPSRTRTWTGEVPVQRSGAGGLVVGGLVALLLLALVGGGLFFFARPTRTVPVASEAPHLDAGTEPVGAGVLAHAPDAGTTGPDAGTAIAAGSAGSGPRRLSAAEARAAELGVPIEELQSPSGTVTPRAPVILALTVEPAVEVSIDGKVVGRSPIKVEVEPGRRRLQLVDRDKGIDLVRFVTVASKGETREQLHLGRGYINVTAPLGSEVFLDGKSLGEAPISEHGVFEGAHRIVVKLGKATWQQAFQLRPDEQLSFDVQTEAP